MTKAQILMQRLKEHRIDHRLSQKEVRVQSGASASTYSKLENGQRIPKLDEVLSIMSALEPSVMDAIYWLVDAGVQFRELKQADRSSNTTEHNRPVGTLEIRYSYPTPRGVSDPQ